MEILLIDDSPFDAKVFAIELGQAEPHFPQLKVAVCHSFTEAKEAIMQHCFDVILLDMNLPESRHERDLQILQDLIALCPDTPVVVYSGIYDSELGRAVMRAGAEDYIIKGTMNPNDLARSLCNAKLRYDARKEASKKLREQLLKSNE